MRTIAGTSRIAACLLVLASTVGVGTSAAEAKPAPTTTTNAPLIARKYAPGECVTWSKHRTSVESSRTVPCATLHVMEMTGTKVRVRGRRYPDEAEWTDLVQQLCTPKVEQYLGQPLDPMGRYFTAGITPSAKYWRLGGRTIDCGIKSHEFLSGEINALVGRVDPGDQAALGAVGTCLAWKKGRGVYAADCRMRHHAEIVGVIDLDGRFDHAPSTAEIDAVANAECQTDAQRYLGRALDERFKASLTWYDEAKWEAGSRTVKCVVTKAETTGAYATRTFTGSLR